MNSLEVLIESENQSVGLRQRRDLFPRFREVSVKTQKLYQLGQRGTAGVKCFDCRPGAMTPYQMVAEELANMNGANLSRGDSSTLEPCSKMLNGIKIMVNGVSSVSASEKFASEWLENYVKLVGRPLAMAAYSGAFRTAIRF